MYNQIPFLKTPINRSAYGSSFYNPLNLFLKIEKSILEDKSPSSFIEYNSVIVHEYSHWLQHQGTTFGAFLHAIKYAQESTVLTFLRDVPKPLMRQLWQLREKGNPIVIIDPTNNQHKPQTYLNNKIDLNLFGQFWYDLQWVYSFMNDCNTIPNPTGQIFGDTISDVFLHNYFYNSRLSNSEMAEIREWYCFQDSDIKVVRFSNQFITSQLLMECQSTLNELQWMIKASFSFDKFFSFEKYFDKRLSSLSYTSYGLPLKLFHSLLHLDPCGSYNLTEIDRICTTVNILIFIALNPPLPPFSLGPPPEDRSWSWQDIYPPLRFIKVIDAVKKIGLINFLPTHKQAKDYLNEIVTISKLPTVIENDFKDSKIFRDIDFSDKSLVLNENTFDSYDFTHWVQKKLSSLRTNSINYLISIANCHFGEASTELIKLKLECSPIQFIQPPLHWRPDGTMASEDNSTFYNGLLRRIGLSYCLFDAVVGSGDFDLQEFPPEISMSENFRDYIKTNLYNLIVETHNN